MSMTFADLGVPSNLVERLASRGISEAFPIQEASIPDALAGKDVVGKAATGSGKTLAFGLPLLARLEKARPRKPTALILVPTRELAAQVQKELAQLTEDKGRRIITIYGGTSYNIARKALNFGVDVVVACPGRLEDMLNNVPLTFRAAPLLLLTKLTEWLTWASCLAYVASSQPLLLTVTSCCSQQQWVQTLSHS